MPANLASLCRAYTPETVRIMAAIVRNKRTPPGVRVQAIAYLWERGWGKPVQTHGGADGGDIQVVVRHILEGSSTPRPRAAAIEHQTVLSDDNTVITVSPDGAKL